MITPNEIISLPSSIIKTNICDCATKERWLNQAEQVANKTVHYLAKRSFKQYLAY